MRSYSLIIEHNGFASLAYRSRNFGSVTRFNIGYFNETVGIFGVFKNSRHFVRKAERTVFTAKQITVSHFFSAFRTFQKSSEKVSKEKRQYSTKYCRCVYFNLIFASPPSEVSLYSDDKSSPVSFIVRITLSSEIFLVFQRKLERFTAFIALIAATALRSMHGI